MSFLTAEWRKLALANYQIKPEILTTYLPPCTEIDLWEGKCYVSLVGFMFLNTKVLGMSIPFHRNFEEVNLRFYVRHKHNGEWRRGVVFIKEIVPKHAITFVANTIYKEHYETMAMRHSWVSDKNSLSVKYDWTKNNSKNSFSIQANPLAHDLVAGSDTEFITEHYWGYTKSGHDGCLEYEVTHPKWQCYDVLNYSIDVDFGKIYGEDFNFLNDITPDSVMLAEGSTITVEKKRKIASQQ